MTSLVPPVPACRTDAVPRRRRVGVTLLELVVVLAVLGVTAAVVLPSFMLARPSVPTLGMVADQARARAIARGQPLELVLGVDGRWMLSTLPGREQHIDSGEVEVPAVPLTIEFSPLGRCALRASAPGLTPAWDAARCRSNRWS